MLALNWGYADPRIIAELDDETKATMWKLLRIQDKQIKAGSNG